MDKPVLIVIDMQEKFAAANDPRTIKACQKLILSAKKDINPIVFIEYDWSGHTLPMLSNLVHGYAFKNVIKKFSDDGSAELHDFFKRCRVVPKHLIVAGVNTNFCVRDTVLGLVNLNYDITLVKDACHSEWPGVEEALQIMRNRGVKVI